MTYLEYREGRQKEFNALPIFWAFSNDQFRREMEKRGLTEDDTDKIYRLGMGGFYLRSDAEKIRAYFDTPDPIHELMKDDEMVDWYGRWHYEPDTPEEKKCDLDRLADAITEAGFIPETDMENLCCMVYAHFECAVEDREYDYEDTFEDLLRYVEDSGGYAEFDYWC